jgi:hypothetical protein
MAWLTCDDYSMIAAFMAVNTYLIDAFTMYAASAMAANTILRSVRMSFDGLLLLVETGQLTDHRSWVAYFHFSDCRCTMLLVW